MKNINKLFREFFIFCTIFFVIKSQSQELKSYLEQAMANNPAIQKFELQYNIASEKVNGVNTLPNTEFGAGYFVSEPETRTGAQRFKISIKQMLPWFGTITSRENYISSMADAKYEDIVIAKRKLITSVSQSYYNLYANKANQKVLEKNIKLLETYETLALTSVEVGKASAVDVLRLQMRQNEMQQVKDVLEQQFLAEQTNFNKLLNRDKAIKVNVINDLNFPSENFDINTDNLFVNPELLKYDKMYQSIEKSELLNQKESAPMIGFGLDYINVSKRSNMDFSDNGKDIVMPMVSISIPIFNNSYKSKTKQNRLQQKEILAQKQDRKNKLEILLDKAINNRISTRINYQTQTKNLKQANDAEKILIKNYETGTIDFNDVLDIQELQLKFEMNQIKSIKSYFIQTTIINYLTD
ncbi:TolC family protein [Tenacibaculum finnmarkense]|uniref:TolC family protein n=2 Tax=Flavobacteriaceae TaxID=49546 RepID=UPI00187B5013|nr:MULTISPECIES: TolC family protein [Tenacibaculum]MCD8425932.1 TolC family protein [Tenacibaculum dicentrarchi]MBE7688977.1 TolC family protein [Tenacibaculum finnmarkense genomovar ulcerans]MBE7693614.1 TolC family protein [Tenacibaculum finnmarkense genomovar finnmarkense]MCD8410989.1 TolC family protein [Tenacibaculum finnmarkense genomovar ulcerans]MCG8184420.1 TolC family protein [Tenacibaculum piscium]